MATKKQVDNAIQKRWGKNAFLEWRDLPSSQEARDKAIAAYREAKQAADEAEAEYKTHLPSSFTNLVKQARFFVDTEAANAKAAFLFALIAAERELEAKANRDAALAEKRAVEKRGGRYYYRYKACRNDGIFTVVEAEADSLEEMLAKVQSPNPKSMTHCFTA